MAKRKTGTGSSKSKRPAKRKVAAKAKKPARRVAKAAPKKAALPKKVAARKKVAVPKKVAAPNPLGRPGFRRSVKSRTSVARQTTPMAPLPMCSTRR